jgi:hypothetical protein
MLWELQVPRDVSRRLRRVPIHLTCLHPPLPFAEAVHHIQPHARHPVEPKPKLWTTPTLTVRRHRCLRGRSSRRQQASGGPLWLPELARRA